MRRSIFVLVLGLSVMSSPASAQTQGLSDVYQSVAKSVNRTRLETFLKDMTGGNTVKLGNETLTITDRYSPESKAKFRKYWTAYYKSLGMDVTEMAYPTQHSNGEENGHNLEAVLPGKSKDSIVIIVHYDSVGERGMETENPGVDDDMTGMAMQLEEASILAGYRDRLQHTVRFVAADYEEWTKPGLEGARQYAKYISDLSSRQRFKVVAAIDNEQSGWNCSKEGLCKDDSRGDVFDIFSCSPKGEYEFKEIGDAMELTASQLGVLKVERACIGENSDHYAMWEIGVPAVVFGEHHPFENPHFDQNGGDTFEKIDMEYFHKISQVGITFAAQLVGIADPVQ